MSDENKKDFNAMLNNSKDMPKYQRSPMPKAFKNMGKYDVFCAADRL